MRDIVFRGKRNDTGKLVYGYYIHLNSSEPLHIIVSEDGQYHTIIPATVGQYTGLQDKNGTRIFEGDIVMGLFLFGLPVKSVVEFRDGAFGLKWNRGSVEEFFAFTSICNVTYEVLGNIHENPELWEEQNA